MNAKVEQKDRSHENILASAARLLREKGIAGARVAEVMKGAGLTVGGFYAHFASKEALIDDTIRRTSAALRAELFGRLDAKPKEARAEIVLKRYLSARHRDDIDRGCPLPAVVGEVGTTAPQHRESVREMLEEMTTGLEEHLPPEGPLPRRTIALGLLAMMYGGLSLARALRGSPLSDEMIKACRTLGAFAARAGAEP
ncbi:TetR/AcrR family transcriptional regulator [Chondromyces crocatus]|uniref:TetR family transcriptional regulator n=1 Tax=Chondromyces crocatus TaxID=52 RepID=A0A0K1EPC0_CHOCO|nr:TetR/AcrR family transcriptional regulator [Chondromyces crocatus]AKT42468.1 TetR family transcriptional regulator [Chondromyces crocatus]